jgi:hypothetical protein
MKYNFLGFQNWQPMSGTLDMLQGFEVFRASLSASIPRDMCEHCICWRLFGTCTQVQVEDYEGDALARGNGGYEGMNDCVVFKNCCPVLFFDFIGVKLPILKDEEI